MKTINYFSGSLLALLFYALFAACNNDLLIWRQYLELKCVKIMQPRIGSDQSLNIFYQALTLEYRSTEPCSCYNKAIDEICRRLELHRKRGILSIVALITFIMVLLKPVLLPF